MTAVAHVVEIFRGPSRNGTSSWRFAVLALVMVIFGAVMVWRLVSLQVLNPERYVEHGESQRIRSRPLVAERGAILDRNGIELAVSSPRDSIWGDPRLVTEPEATASAIVAIVGGDVEQLTRRLSNADAKFAWMARQLDDEAVAQVLALGLDGIYASAEQARLTPSGNNVARAILGRTDVDGIGLSGLEKQFDEILTGEEGRVVVERGLAAGGARAVTIPDGRYELVAAKPGSSIQLTIDRTLQFEVEKLLEQTVVRSGADSGTVIMSRSKTGEILAMATVSRSDEGVVAVSGENRGVTWIVEPGSISKPIAMAALIEEGLVSPDTTVEVPYQLEIYDAVFSDSAPHETLVMTAADIVEQSSNVGMVLLSNRLGKQGMYDYLDNFGIGSSTALDFPGESAGLLHEVDDWSGVSLPSAAIGYGYAATPLQMLRAYTVFANGGLLVEPHLVSQIENRDGEVTILTPTETRRVISEDTATTMTSLLANVVRNGTGQLASVPGYEIAGKTGTARIAQPGGGYENENGEVELLTSFTGFLPASDPELSMIVMIENPDGSASGGRLAAPLFGEISNFALQHFRIPPADTVESLAYG